MDSSGGNVGLQYMHAATTMRLVNAQEKYANTLHVSDGVGGVIASYVFLVAVRVPVSTYLLFLYKLVGFFIDTGPFETLLPAEPKRLLGKLTCQTLFGSRFSTCQLSMYYRIKNLPAASHTYIHAICMYMHVWLSYNLFISTVGSPVHVVRSSYRSCCCRYCNRFNVIVWAVVVLIGVFTSICWYQFIDTVVAISLATISSDQLAS